MEICREFDGAAVGLINMHLLCFRDDEKHDLTKGKLKCYRVCHYAHRPEQTVRQNGGCRLATEVQILSNSLMPCTEINNTQHCSNDVL